MLLLHTCIHPIWSLRPSPPVFSGSDRVQGKCEHSAGRNASCRNDAEEELTQLYQRCGAAVFMLFSGTRSPKRSQVRVLGGFPRQVAIKVPVGSREWAPGCSRAGRTPKEELTQLWRNRAFLLEALCGVGHCRSLHMLFWGYEKF